MTERAGRLSVGFWILAVRHSFGFCHSRFGILRPGFHANWRARNARNIFCLRGLDLESGCSYQRFSTVQTHITQTTKPTRRNFLRTAGLGLGALGFAAQAVLAAEKP